jgi:hypothetical protein
MQPSRRSILRLLSSALLPWASGKSTESAAFAHYRAHATISLLSVPIFSKQDVGGAVLQVEQRAARNAETVAVQFCAGSWPDRIVESNYLSFMTSSPEKNLAQAKQSFVESKSVSFSADHGRTAEGEYTSVVDHIALSGARTWFDCRQVADSLKQSFSQAAPHKRTGGALATFLYAARDAVLRRVPCQIEFLHAAKIYRLTSAWPNPALMEGTIRDDSGHVTSQFKVQIDRNDPTAMPLYFEFRPKSFLTLRFQRTEPQTAPSLQSLLREESA